MSIHEISICESDPNFFDLAGRRKAITCKVRNTLDRYGADIFKSGRATQPKKSLLCSENTSKKERSTGNKKPITIYSSE